MKLSPIQQRIWNLRELMKLYSVTGDYKAFKTAKKDYAKEFVAHPEIAMNMPPTNRVSAPVFSKSGWNILKTGLLYVLFGGKSPEEKQMIKLVKEAKAKKDFNIQI